MSTGIAPESVQAPPAALPYAGLRVLDASQGLAGPYCGMLLAQYGAEVIKVEPPEGDWSRGIGARHGTHSAIDLMGNRGKLSIALDLKSDAARAAVRRMATQCDVLIESYRPGVAQRLGLGYAELAQAHPGLIHVSVSGYGQSGERAAMPGTDTVIQAYSGMMALNADASGTPQRVGFLAVDTATALYAFQAVSVALFARTRGAGGCHLDISLMQATAALLSARIIETSLEGAAPQALNVPAGVYRSSDGWLAVTLSKEAHFAALCEATGCTGLATDPRLASFQLRAAHAGWLRAQFAAVFEQRPTAQWLQILPAHGVLVSPVNSVGQWLDDPHVLASGAAPESSLQGQPLRFPAIPGLAPPPADDPRAAWPGIGSHSAQVLAGFGFKPDEIAALRSSGAMLTDD